MFRNMLIANRGDRAATSCDPHAAWREAPGDFAAEWTCSASC